MTGPVHAALGLTDRYLIVSLLAVFGWPAAIVLIVLLAKSMRETMDWIERRQAAARDQAIRRARYTLPRRRTEHRRVPS